MNISNPIYCGVEQNISHIEGIVFQLFSGVVFAGLIVLYVLAVIYTNRNYKKWPISRMVCWLLGVLSVALSFLGPIASQSHLSFTAHMVGHLLLGMLAPLLIVMAAPMTLLFRALNVNAARKLIRILKMRYFRYIMDPLIISILHVGGLWILYTTNLYAAMHQHFFLFMLIHVHVFLAGYLFTQSMINMESIPHRTGFLYRSIVMILAFTFHGMLSKYIYAHPPIGVSATQAEIGGMIMYYGGDMIDIMMIYLLCKQWFKAVRPRDTIQASEA